LDKPDIFVQKSFERNQMSVGDEVKITIFVKNTGTGQAQNIVAEDLPPLPEFSYIAGYPPKIKDTLDPGESDSAIYVISAVKEGSIRVPAVQVSYTDSKKNARSNNSEPLNILINPKSKADLQLILTPPQPIGINDKGMLNVSIINLGKASATRVQVDDLLSQGKIDEAESFMEEQRKIFWENGYQIRKLNQAYFAFHGAYADVPGGAAGSDPVGPAVRELRARSNSLAEFIKQISRMTSFEQLKDALNS
jgi:uncharacterized repeat protein (TIGR01451 family)